MDRTCAAPLFRRRSSRYFEPAPGQRPASATTTNHSTTRKPEREPCMNRIPALAGIAAAIAIAAASALTLPTPATAQDGTPRFDNDLFGSLGYRYVGPSRGGRVTAVAGHVDQPSTFYMGATGGGVWKTTDYGHVWRNISDGYIGTGSIGAIRVAESDPNVVYVSTGSDGPAQQRDHRRRRLQVRRRRGHLEPRGA